jgi:hypothetical protein
MDLKNGNTVVRIITRVFVESLTKARLIFIAAIPIGFQISNQNTRRCSKTSKGSHKAGGGQNSLKVSTPLPFRMNPL